LTPGNGWESSDVLNPSVVRFQDQLWNFYSGFDGHTWHTGVATSADGASWHKRGRTLSPDAQTWEGGYIAANGHALVVRDEILYWYQGGRPARIGLARSRDGLAFTKQQAPVLDVGPYGSWDERGVADPYVIEAAGTLYLFYTGMDRAQRQRLGVARSSDGVHWEKSRANPVLELGGRGAWDEAGLGEPAVFAAHGQYWMLYTGRAWNEERRTGWAVSADGVAWRKIDAPLLPTPGAWGAKVVCDPTVLGQEPDFRVWFGAGHLARPDERIHGQIGVARLRSTIMVKKDSTSR
jgi:predicted GH43/DUF377 family glycosyl hydrolase